ncbi:MAG: hypothetical protein JO097_04430 [Acidobacteriaceae bacterium]|nr:hypothetical protein [Acidobacteriaceae bacterium]
MLWSRKSPPVHDRVRAIGLDLNAGRVRAEAVGGKSRPLVLDDPDTELLLFVTGERRVPEVGRAGFAICRTLPHLVCSNFLAALGQSREWRIGRHTLIAEVALGLIFDKIRGPVTAETDAIALALPAYLGPAQVSRVGITAGRLKFPLKGTAVGALALVADRAPALLTGKPAAPESARADWVVPLRPSAGGPGAVVIIDADEFALSAALVSVGADLVRLVGSAAWPRLAVKAWKDRLLDAVADRCVRLCRRDPRDSAEAEQALFEQLDEALDRTRSGQRISLCVRTARWFQDVIQQPDEFESHCAALARLAGESLRDFTNGIGLAEPPRAVWLTDSAGRLPGLVRAVHANTPEGTAVEVLPPSAIAAAAAALVPQWLAGALPRTHLDSVIPLPQLIDVRKPSGSPAAPRSGSGSMT